MNNSYEINEGTLALISKDKFNTKILEDKSTYLIENNSLDILDSSCKYFGSSYEGRKEGSKSIMGCGYKIPIVVEDTMNLVFFPTTSPEDDNCIWIAVNQIKDYQQEKYNMTKIIFKNNEELVVPFSFRSIENQIFRATRLSYILKMHLNSKK